MIWAAIAYMLIGYLIETWVCRLSGPHGFWKGLVYTFLWLPLLVVGLIVKINERS